MVRRCEECFNYDVEIIKKYEDIQWIKDGRRTNYGFGFQQVRVKCPFCGHEKDTKIMYQSTVDQRLQWDKEKKKKS